MALTNKQFCEKYGITMSELARRANVGRSTLYDLDNNRYKCRSSFKVSYARSKIEQEHTPPAVEKGSYIDVIVSVILFLFLVIILVLA